MRGFSFGPVWPQTTYARRLALTLVLLAAMLAAGCMSVGPVSAAAEPAADCTPLACSQVKVTAPYVLNFDQNNGGLLDKNGVGTGFTWVDKPTGGGVGYIPANLEVDTTAGVLKLTTTAGIAYLAANDQDNTLGVGIDAGSHVSLLDARLVNFPALNGEQEQAGLWYGADDDNYLKLVVISQKDGATIQERIQFIEERNGVEQQQVVSSVIPLTGATVDLRLVADPLARTVTAYYGLNGGALQLFKGYAVPSTLFNAGATIDPAVGTAVFGGVFASDRFRQGTALFEFDSFSLTAGAAFQRLYLPLVLNAGS